ncbi:MAG: nuclear transport factor 2 family protein [Pseudomonadota bacterium]|nr:nuclear transport factor 2 family protein [Pseudomonadota bacterium]
MGDAANAQTRRGLFQRAPEPVAAPVIDPETWWEPKEVIPEARFDPLGRRRAARPNPALAALNNSIDPSLYRLWGLQPLQWLALRRSETVYEAWYRPTNSARQAVVRVTLRGDGRAFVQARAGLGCCSPEIGRRVDIDAELPQETRQQLLQLRQDPLWSQPRHVVVNEAGAASTVCVEGVSYDITLVDDRRAVHLRRACDPAELGSIAPALQAIIGAALGRDPRFDYLFARQKFADHAAAHQALLEGGGRLDPVAGAVARAAPQADAAPAESTEASAETAAAEAVAEIMAADRAFAARASERTAAEAFREFMDAEGLLFRDNAEPVRGKEAIYARFGGAAPEQGKLLWEPVQAWASESGDFGASWGRSRFVPNDRTKPATAFRYMTVWRRDAQGRWRGLMDMGVPANDLVAPAAQKPPPASR